MTDAMKQKWKMRVNGNLHSIEAEDGALIPRNMPREIRDHNFALMKEEIEDSIVDNLNTAINENTHGQHQKDVDYYTDLLARIQEDE